MRRANARDIRRRLEHVLNVINSGISVASTSLMPPVRSDLTKNGPSVRIAVIGNGIAFPVFRIKLAICIYEVSIQAFGLVAKSGIVRADRETKVVIAGLSLDIGCTATALFGRDGDRKMPKYFAAASIAVVIAALVIFAALVSMGSQCSSTGALPNLLGQSSPNASTGKADKSIPERRERSANASQVSKRIL